MRRVLTAMVLAPVALAVVIWAPIDVFAPLVVLVGVLALRELFDLAGAQGVRPYRWIGLAGAGALIVQMEVPWTAGFLTAAVLIGVLIAVLARALSQPGNMAQSIGNAGATLLGVLYVGFGLGATGAVRYLGGTEWLVFLLLLVWLGDVAALYAGKLWGRHAMAPRVSPHKTWEGAAASMVAALGVGAGFGAWFTGHIWTDVALAAGLNVAAQFGDLVESLCKRGAQVKDSSGLLPGHGGVLDRIDALLLAAPVLWYYLAYFPR